PASMYPKVSDGTAVPMEKWKFPDLPGIRKVEERQSAFEIDFGPEFASKRIITKEPPEIGKRLDPFVPQVNADGNELAGVHVPELAVPLATYTGWNLRAERTGAPNQRVSFVGSTIPFPKTVEERQQTHDPRPSIAERYSGKDDYLKKY